MMNKGGQKTSAAQVMKPPLSQADQSNTKHGMPNNSPINTLTGDALDRTVNRDGALRSTADRLKSMSVLARIFSNWRRSEFNAVPQA
jgi:hypothetical protein